MITIEELKEQIEKIGYYATEELIYDTFNALDIFSTNKINPGQDIYAICLEGPPGAGKTEFAKVYTKLSNQLFNDNVEMVEYQCDATTGKTELFEDINISAAIKGDADHVNIPGKLVEAINKVNSGKKVVLFIDEYDKAREETDAFLLQFLQSGKINATQHGDLEVKDEYKSNLQVIFCKNDMREELSGPLSRRIRIIRLDYMEPSIFYKVAHRNLIEEREDKVNDGLLNMVSLMYQAAYENKEIYNRLPSCSEMLIALEDADRIVKKANAPQHIVYKTLIKNMFKSLDDIKTFESSLTKSKDGLMEVIKSMCKQSQTENTTDLNSLIAKKVLKDESQKLDNKIEEMEKLINEYKVKFSSMEEKRQQVIDEEVRKVLLENGKLVAAETPSVIHIFEDESAYIKRGYNIFEITNNDWTDIGNMKYSCLSQSMFINKIINNAAKLDIKVFENGILLKEDENLKLIVVIEKIDDNLLYHFMASEPVIPSTYLKEIYNFIDLADQIVKNYPVRPAKNVFADLLDLVKYQYELNALVYNDTNLDFSKVEENVYNVELIGTDKDDKLAEFTKIAKCSDYTNSIKVSREIMNNKIKRFTNE